MFNALFQERTHQAEGVVSNHQEYSDTYQQTRDWLTTLIDRLDVCAEPSADKLSIQNKLDQLQVNSYLVTYAHALLCIEIKAKLYFIS